MGFFYRLQRFSFVVFDFCLFVGNARYFN